MEKNLRFKLNIPSAKLGDKDPQIVLVQKYLTRFGYLSTTVSSGKLDNATSKALKLFQLSFGLKDTGNLTPETIKTLETKRCGTPDMGMIAAHSNEEGAASNFVLRGCKYNKRNFTYRYINGTRDIAGTSERNAIRNAFNTWASVLCGITFRERTSGSADFLIGWFTGRHGDGSPFDGIGNTLAHAFYPPPCGGANAGSCHFDEAETWSLTGSGTSIDLETVALHEIGHLLGLDHSTVSRSVMFPNYGGVRRNLTQDDIDGIRQYYPFLCRRGDSGSQAGFVAEVAAVKHQSRQVITAVKTQAGKLKLIAWQVNTNGSISRTGDSGNQAGRASWISIAKNPIGLLYVTAVRTSSGKLKLISWDVNSSGTNLSRRGDSGNQAGRASTIKIATVSENRFITAVRTSSNRLKLIGWHMNNNGSLTRLADSGNVAGVVRDISIAGLSGRRLVTAVRTASGNLKLITWRVTDSTITRLGDSGNQAGSARNIKVTTDGFGNTITAVQTQARKLKLITWHINASGSVRRLGDSNNLAGKTGEHDISMVNGNVITAVRTAAGNLKVIIWGTAANGAVSRIGDSNGLAGTASLITLNEELSGVPPILTSVRTASSKLKLISWSTA